MILVMDRIKCFIICLLLTISVQHSSASDIVVTTGKRFARGATMAFGRMSVTGHDVKEAGFCWAETPEPTVDDNKTVKYLVNNGKIYWLQNLSPSTLYYMRAYAVGNDGNVYYGEVIKFYTIPKGTITYTIRDGGATDVKERITNATKSAVDYWNNLTSITGFSTSVGYDGGVNTADCSYGGWIRVGPNSSYQRTGTILHELLHGVGVIPWANTEWSRHNLRASVNGSGYGTGAWLGDRATEVVRFLANNDTDILNGDYQHLWPYGINGAHEDNGSEILYIGNGLICQALGEDGLQHTATSFSRPYYSFTHEEGKKYYIKNESPECGLYDSYLVVSDAGTLVWRRMTASEAITNDSAAWAVTFTPENQYYQFKNVSTGRYLSYGREGSSVMATSLVSIPMSSEDFQLMRGRNELALGEVSLPIRGYWIISPENSWTPKCLQANTKGGTVATVFNIATSAVNQRWLILSGDEAVEVESASVNGIKLRIENSISELETLIAVPHSEDEVGIDAIMESRISNARAAMERSSDIIELKSIEMELQNAVFDFLGSATPNSLEHPFDLTYMLSNPGMDSADGWSVTPAINHSCGEFYQKPFDMNQVLSGMPAGIYRLCAKGFQRPGASADVWRKYSDGQSKVTAFIYLGASARNMNDICVGASDYRLGGSESVVGTPAKYIPNDMKSASIYFSQGIYDNEVVYENNVKGATFKLGVRAASMPEKYWCIFDDFRLYFYGKKKDDVVAIDDAMSENRQDKCAYGVYSLDGRLISKDGSCLESLPNGIYIVNGRKVVR